MTEEELLELLEHPEGEGIEYKKTWREISKSAYPTVSAFANTNGGWLILGVSDKGIPHKITGISSSKVDEAQHNFLSGLRDRNIFSIYVDAKMQHHKIQGKHILAFYIPEAQRHEKPVYLHGNPRNSYCRHGGSSVRMQEHQWKSFVRDADNISWDSVILEDADLVASIDADTLDWYIDEFYKNNYKEQKISDHTEFLLKWNFAKYRQDDPMPTRAAIMLFGKPQFVGRLVTRLVLDYWRINKRRRDWSSADRWNDRIKFEANLFNIWRDLIGKYSELSDHSFRLNSTIPDHADTASESVALRELLINLLMHQDYSDGRAPTIRWFIDQIEFENCGDALVDVSPESSQSKSRNLLIVDAFRRVGLCEQAGIGIPKINRNWCGMGYTPPQIKNEKTYKTFTTTLSKKRIMNESMRETFARMHLTVEQAKILALASVQKTITKMDAIVVIGGNRTQACATIDDLLGRELIVESEGEYALEGSLAQAMNRKVQRVSMYIPRTLEIIDESDKHSQMTDMDFASLAQPKVLLGAPGGGKTSVCKEIAHRFDGKLKHAESILSSSFNDSPNFNGQMLIVDGLDEVLSEDIPKAFAKIINTIKQLGYDNWLISCRSYEWLQGSFYQIINSSFSKPAKIANLGDLSDDDIKLFLSHFINDGSAEEFFRKAERQEATDFMKNPQTLQMLVQAVQFKGWPKTKTELLYSACKVMASEYNSLHQEKDTNRPTEEQIIDTAGWICTQLLMSRTQAIALDGRDSEKTPRPAHLANSAYSKEIISKTCQTKIFKPTGTGRVEPTHRTVAEFLAGRWLAEQFNANPRTLSFARVMESITFGTSTIPPALRGLYAWIISLDASNRLQNIKRDPYGCLRYGDLSGFSDSELIALLKELASFTKVDPYFQGSDWNAQFGHSLGRASIKKKFVEIISDANTSFRLKFTLLQAIRGTELAGAMVEELKAIVFNEKEAQVVRSKAASALAGNLQPNDWRYIAKKLLTSGTIDSLRISIDHVIPDEHVHFTGTEIAKHLIAYEKKLSNDEENRVLGIGFKIPRICSDIQVAEMAKLIAAEIPIDRDIHKLDLYTELEEWLTALFPRLLKQSNKPTANELWPLISKLSYQSHKFDWEGVPLWFAEHEDIRREIQACAFDEAQDANAKRRALYWLSKISAGLHISESDAIHHLERLIVAKDSLSNWQSSWEVLIWWVRGYDNFDDSVLKLAKKQAENFPELKRILEEVMNPPIDEYEAEHLERERHRKEKALAEIQQRHARFSEVREEIEKGEHFAILGAAAESVLGHYSDLKEATSPKESLMNMVGQENLAPVILGFKVAVERDDIPNVRDCANLRVSEGNAYYLGRISFALSMLMIEAGEPLSLLPKKVQLCALSASWSGWSFREEVSEKIRSELGKILFQEHGIKRSFVKDMIESRLEAGEEIPWGFWHSGQGGIFSDILPDLALEWLTNFENVDDHIALDLLNIAIRFVDDKSKFADIIEIKIQDNDWVNEERRRAWHVVAFFLDFDRFYSAVYKFANEDKQNLWPFRDIIKGDEYGKFSALPLSVKQTAFLLETFAHQWSVSSPTYGGFVGLTNPWDATEYLQYLIRILSGQKSKEAIKCLENLVDSGSMGTYEDYVKHELDKARHAFAETRHQEAKLEDVRQILSSGKPVNVSDLQILFVEEFEEYQARIRTGHTDTYKTFWDRDEPHVENYCRDRLLDGLEQEMGARSVRVHKEGAMANETRVDLLFSCGDFDLPVEIKRQWHPNLWTAAREQLERYSENYRTDGTGVYLVIWHGDVEGKTIPKPPIGEHPKSAGEMLQALLDNSGDLSPKTKIVVLDVSKPLKSVFKSEQTKKRGKA